MTVLGMELFNGWKNVWHIPRYGADMTVLGMELLNVRRMPRCSVNMTILQTQKNTKSLHNLNSIYFSYTSLFLAFTKEITVKMKKSTQIWKMYTNMVCRFSCFSRSGNNIPKICCSHRWNIIFWVISVFIHFPFLILVCFIYFIYLWANYKYKQQH